MLEEVLWKAIQWIRLWFEGDDLANCRGVSLKEKISLHIISPKSIAKETFFAHKIMRLQYT